MKTKKHKDRDLKAICYQLVQLKHEIRNVNDINCNILQKFADLEVQIENELFTDKPSCNCAEKTKFADAVIKNLTSTSVAHGTQRGFEVFKFHDGSKKES